MAKRHLTDEDVEKIISAIMEHPIEEMITWEKIRIKLARVFRFKDVEDVWSRQQLPKYHSIKEAYEIKRKKHKELKLRMEGRIIDKNKSASERKLIERVEKLEAEKERLKRENDHLQEKFARWQYNATQAHAAKRLTLEELDMPMYIKKESKDAK